MNNMVVVTLKIADYEKDFELPADIRLSKLYPRVASVLQQEEYGRFRSYNDIIFELDGAGLLDKRASLYDYGVCAGCILNVVHAEKYRDFR